MTIEAWQKIIVALRLGIIMKPSGTKRWIANTTVFTTEPRHGTMHSFPDIPADTELEAARTVANMAAQMFYHRTDVHSSFLSQVGEHLFRATIGTYDYGVIKGHTVEILIRERGED